MARVTQSTHGEPPSELLDDVSQKSCVPVDDARVSGNKEEKRMSDASCLIFGCHMVVLSTIAVDGQCVSGPPADTNPSFEHGQIRVDVVAAVVHRAECFPVHIRFSLFAQGESSHQATCSHVDTIPRIIWCARLQAARKQKQHPPTTHITPQPHHNAKFSSPLTSLKVENSGCSSHLRSSHYLSSDRMQMQRSNA